MFIGSDALGSWCMTTGIVESLVAVGATFVLLIVMGCVHGVVFVCVSCVCVCVVCCVFCGCEIGKSENQLNQLL